MRRILAALTLLLLASPAYATDYYFSSGTGGNITAAASNSNSCTLVSPCVDPNGKGLSAPGALGPDDTLWLDAGDTWTNTQIWIISNGTSGHPITLKGYGAGKAKLMGVTLYPSGWTSCNGSSSPACPASGTYYMTGISWTNDYIYVVTQGTNVQTARGLYKWGESMGNTLATMPEKHFWFDSSADRVYVRLPGGTNPDTDGTVGIPGFVTGPSANGARGIICTGCENGSYGDYVEIDTEHLEVLGSNGMGITLGGHHNKIYDADQTDIDIAGTGADSVLTYYGQVAGEEANDSIVDGIWAAFGSTAGTGHGQTFTNYAPRVLWINVKCSDSGMACFDQLQGFDAASDTSQSAIKNAVAIRPGQWGDPDGYDPGFYFDGANNVTLKDFVCSDAGTGTDGAGQGNARGCVSVGTEHDSDPASQIDIVNGLIHTTHWAALSFTNTTGTDNTSDIRVAYVTAIAYRSGPASELLVVDDLVATANTLKIRNSIFYAEDSYPVSNWMNEGDRFDFDRIQYYRQGGGTTIYRKYDGSVNWTLATWQSASGEDANSAYGDPKFITDTEGSYDVHLQRVSLGQASTSPAIDAGETNAWACPSYLYSQWPTYFPECAPGGVPVTGTTASDGSADNMGTAPDLGYHYALAASHAGTLY